MGDTSYLMGRPSVQHFQKILPFRRFLPGTFFRSKAKNLPEIYQKILRHHPLGRRGDHAVSNDGRHVPNRIRAPALARMALRGCYDELKIAKFFQNFSKLEKFWKIFVFRRLGQTSTGLEDPIGTSTGLAHHADRLCGSLLLNMTADSFFRGRTFWIFGKFPINFQ